MNNKHNMRFLSRGKRILSLRFFLIFIIAGSFGLILLKNTSDSIVNQTELRAFFKSLRENEYEFLNTSITSSLTYILIIALASISALTFFCPMMLHCLSALCGIICGIRVGILLSLMDFEFGLFAFTMVHIAFIVVFATILSVWSAYFLNVNKSFINEERHSKKSVILFISPTFRSWLLHSLTLTISFSIIVVLYCVLMRILI
jgi:hypothetical protein